MWNSISGYGAGYGSGCGIPYQDVDPHIRIWFWVWDSISGYGPGCGIPYLDVDSHIWIWNTASGYEIPYLDTVLVLVLGMVLDMVRGRGILDLDMVLDMILHVAFPYLDMVLDVEFRIRIWFCVWNSISGYGSGCGIPHLDVDSHIWIWNTVSGYEIPYLDMVLVMVLDMVQDMHLDMVLYVGSHIWRWCWI